MASLRELLGVIGAHEWRKNGVEIPALDARIHPHYGVFSPIRGEYVRAGGRRPAAGRRHAAPSTSAPAPACWRRCWRSAASANVVATDMDQRALSLRAREHRSASDLQEQVELVQADLFPEGRAPLVVCNPPWLPGRPSSSIEYAIYDPDSRMLRGFLAGLAAHLEPGGEGWLILSDLAEHLGLRPRDQLMGWIEAAGLKVIDRHDVRPTHPRASDATDPLHAARAAEVTSLWRLAAAN